MNAPRFLQLAVLLLAAMLSYGAAHEFDAQFRTSTLGANARDSKDPRFPGPGGYGMPGGGIGGGIPGWGSGGEIPSWGGGGGGEIPGPHGGHGWGGGWGAGYGGPGGGYARGGVVRPSVVCRDRGPCYGKRLSCPARCFTSYSRSGRNYGYGGGGGGCTIDCTRKCVAYC